MSSEELLVPVPWGNIAAKAWGFPKDERVLLVHGILDNAGSFDRLIALMPKGYYFVAIDLPGHGLSSHLPAGIPLDFFNYVLSIRRVLDYLKWETCVFLGHSLGAHLGIMFTAIYPERITKVLCIDGINSKPLANYQLTPQIQRIHSNTLSIKDEGTRAAKLYTKEEVMYILINQRENALNIAAAEALMKRSVSAVGNKYKFNRDPRLNAGLLPLFSKQQHLTMLEQIDIPVRIILASVTVSKVLDRDVRELILKASLKPKFSFMRVEGNHDVHNNYPERIAPHVCSFLGSVKSSL